MNNIKCRVEAIEKAMKPGGIPEHDSLQIIIGHSINGEFIPNDPKDTLATRKASLLEKYGTTEGAIFIELVDRFGKPEPKPA
jgi:hypothetical protein